MDRAQIGGLDDVGIGALFGLDDYRCVTLLVCLSRVNKGLFYLPSVHSPHTHDPTGSR